MFKAANSIATAGISVPPGAPVMLASVSVTIKPTGWFSRLVWAFLRFNILLGWTELPRIEAKDA